MGRLRKTAAKKTSGGAAAQRGAGERTRRATTSARKRGSSSSTAKRAGRLRRESLAQRKQRAMRILANLHERYPAADCALAHGDALQLLIATILSAQCTDERVNLVTPALFEAYPDAPALAASEPAALEELVRSTGFFRNKAKNLRGMAKMLCEEFDGEVPATMDQLLRLPGVARKTANCVLGTWFGRNEGVVVDTHVGRLAERLGLLLTASDSKDAVKIERDLMELFPQTAWTYLAHALIHHGRQICTARKPKCDACPLAADCPSAGSFA